MSRYYEFPHDGQGASDLVNTGSGNSSSNNNNNNNQVLPPTDFDRGHELPPSQYLPNVNYPLSFVAEEEPPGPAPKNTGQARRRLPLGTDHVKHRRTRSGCYTCRSRRVKCDEARPICERCKKGSRDCLYPEPSSATTSISSSKLSQTHRASRGTDSSSGESGDEDAELSPIVGGNSPGDSRTPIISPSEASDRTPTDKKGRRALNQTRSAPSSSSQFKEKSLSPSTDESSIPSSSRSASVSFTRAGTVSSFTTNSSQGNSRWSHLSRDKRYYLDFHQNHITYHHYFFKYDSSHFTHSILLDEALEYKPLLYAVIGFAAYQVTVKKQNGKIEDFLPYYQSSVSSLRKSLSSGQPHTDATILTVLQLAAFEEYLGDWVNLLEHQRGAYEMLQELYTTDTIMQSETSRKILAWYSRFDLFAGLMGRNEMILGRDWFLACESYHKVMASRYPDNIDYRIGYHVAGSRVLAMDMAQMFAKVPKGVMSMEDFRIENETLSQRIRDRGRSLDPFLAQKQYLIMSFEGAPPRDPDSIVDPYEPGLLYQGPMWPLNYMMIDWMAVDAMHRNQTAQILQQPPPADIVRLALKQCQLLEAIDMWPGSPAGAILPAQASLGLVCLFLPRDEKHTTWCRRKLAKFESQGYIFPPTFRTGLIAHWAIPDLATWWLPHEQNLPPIIKAIRAFTGERTQKPRDHAGEEIRSMKGLFSSMSLNDSPRESPDSSGSFGDEGALEASVVEEREGKRDALVTSGRPWNTGGSGR